MNIQYSLKELKIEVTQQCILNCIHCSSEANITKTKELSEDIVLRIIEDAHKMGVKEITFSGGEPLLWRPLIKAINNCQELGIKVSIYTTGIPIIEDQNLKKRLKITQSDKIITSLYGANEESHENITRINGSFKKTIKAIKEFINCGVPVGIHFVAMKPNWEQLKEVVRLADQLGIFAVSVLRFVPHGRGTIVNHYNLSKHELRQLRKMIIYLRGNSKTYIRLGSPFNILLLNQNIFIA